MREYDPEIVQDVLLIEISGTTDVRNVGAPDVLPICPDFISVRRSGIMEYLIKIARITPP